MNPRVTVVVPVYNHERFIRECVDSVLAQDYQPLEVIVVDDGSTDGTPAILRSYGERLHVISQENAGAARALNRGLRAATGDWVGWLSSDDVYESGKIAAQIATASQRTRAALLYTDWIKIDAEGRELSRHECADLAADRALWQLLLGNSINGSSVLLRRDAIEQHGLFNEELRADVDGEMWFRLLLAGVEFARTPGYFLRYRWHAQNMSHRRLLMRQSMDATRTGVVQRARAEQLFPPTAPGGRAEAARALVDALVRHEAYGAAALALERAVAEGLAAPVRRLWATPFRMLGSPRSEPLIAGWRLGRRVTERLRRVRP